jgi:transcription elongation factor Elf1
MYVAVVLDVLALLEQVQDYGGRFVCPVCGNSVSTKGNLKVHLDTQHGSKKHPSRCDLCGTFAKNKNALRRHKQRNHSNIL